MLSGCLKITFMLILTWRMEWRTDKQISNDLSIYQTHKNQMSDFDDQMSQGKTINNQRSPCWSSPRYSPRVVRLVVIHLSEYQSYHSRDLKKFQDLLRELSLARVSHKYLRSTAESAPAYPVFLYGIF